MSSDTRSTAWGGLVEQPLILAVSHRTVDRRALIDIDGELDMAGSEMLRTAVLEALEDPDEVDRIEVDTTKVVFVDSAGLNLLLNLQVDAARVNVALEVAAVSRSFRRVVELAGLDDVLLPPP